MSNTKKNDVRCDVLNRLVLKPRVKQAARDARIHPTPLFGWIKQSVAGDPKMVLMWLGHEAPFHQHVNAARKLNIVALDHAARDLAINGHSEPRYPDGKPVYKRDPKIEADALSMDELEWEPRRSQRRDPAGNSAIESANVASSVCECTMLYAPSVRTADTPRIAPNPKIRGI